MNALLPCNEEKCLDSFEVAFGHKFDTFTDSDASAPSAPRGGGGVHR